MADQRILATEEMVAAGHSTKADTLNRLALVEHNNDGTHKQNLKPAFSAHRNGSVQAITTSTWTKVAMTTELFDVTGAYASSKFTPLVAGKYLITAQLRFDNNQAATYIVAIYKNGAAINQKRLSDAGGTTLPITPDITCILDADGVSDYFEVYAWQNSGSNKNINGTASETFFMGSLIS